MKTGCLTLLVLAVVFSQIVSSCVSFRPTDEKVLEFYQEEPHRPQSVFYEKDSFEMHYRLQDLGHQASLIFIHGTPGSWGDYMEYFRDSLLYSQFNIVAADRPGFGKSTFGDSFESLEKQAHLLKPMMEQIPSPRILVGHSLGGPVVARMAMDYPELIDGLVMLAPALDPELEPNQDWFRVPMRWIPFRWFIPKVLRASNNELIHLDEQLELMLPLWGDIEIPTIVIQGGEDNLVHPDNAAFADSMMLRSPVEVVFLEEQNHFLPWAEYELVRQKILELYQEISSR